MDDLNKNSEHQFYYSNTEIFNEYLSSCFTPSVS